MHTKTGSDKTFIRLTEQILDFLSSASTETNSDDLITTWRYLAYARKNGSIQSDDIGNWAMFMLAILDRNPRSTSLTTLRKSLQRIANTEPVPKLIRRELSQSLAPRPVFQCLAPAAQSTWWTFTGRKLAKEPWKLLGWQAPSTFRERHGPCRKSIDFLFKRHWIWSQRLYSLTMRKDYRTMLTSQ